MEREDKPSYLLSKDNREPLPPLPDNPGLSAAIITPSGFPLTVHGGPLPPVPDIPDLSAAAMTPSRLSLVPEGAPVPPLPDNPDLSATVMTPSGFSLAPEDIPIPPLPDDDRGAAAAIDFGLLDFSDDIDDIDAYLNGTTFDDIPLWGDTTLAELPGDDNPAAQLPLPVATIPDRVSLSKADLEEFQTSEFFDAYPAIKTKLAPHQRYAIKWLKDTMDRFNKHAVLADGTGLGKTFSSLGVLAYLHFCSKNTDSPIKNVLIIVPANAIKQWQIEIDRFTKATGFKCQLETSNSSSSAKEKAKKPRLDAHSKQPSHTEDHPCITLRSRQSISCQKTPFPKGSFELVVADEFHTCSTAEKFFGNIQNLVDGYVLALTATPFRNHVDKESRKWVRCGFTSLSQCTLRRTPDCIPSNSLATMKIPKLRIEPVTFDLLPEQRSIYQLIARGIIQKELKDIGVFFNRHLLRRLAISIASIPAEQLTKIRKIVSEHRGVISKETWIRIQRLINPKGNSSSEKGILGETTPQGDASPVLAPIATATATVQVEAKGGAADEKECEECTICLEEMNLKQAGVDGAEEPKDRKVVATNCGHFFHAECLNRDPKYRLLMPKAEHAQAGSSSKEKKPNCFLCRTPVTVLTSIAELKATLVTIEPRAADSPELMPPKIQFIMDHLHKNRDESAIIASPYKQTLFQLEEVLRAEQITCVNLSSQEKRKKSHQKIAAFQKGNARVCLLTYQMGESLNLQKASSLFLIGPHHSVIAETQMMGRIQRMNSDHKQVTVYRMSSNGTIELHINEQNEKKSTLIQNFYDGLGTTDELQEGIRAATIGTDVIANSIEQLATTPMAQASTAGGAPARKKRKQQHLEENSDSDWDEEELASSDGLASKVAPKESQKYKKKARTTAEETLDGQAAKASKAPAVSPSQAPGANSATLFQAANRLVGESPKSGAASSPNPNLTM